METAEVISDDVQQTFDNVSNSYRQLLEDRIKKHVIEFTMKYYNYSALKKNIHPDVLKEHITECYNRCGNQQQP